MVKLRQSTSSTTSTRFLRAKSFSIFFFNGLMKKKFCKKTSNSGRKQGNNKNKKTQPLPPVFFGPISYFWQECHSIVRPHNALGYGQLDHH